MTGERRRDEIYNWISLEGHTIREPNDYNETNLDRTVRDRHVEVVRSFGESGFESIDYHDDPFARNNPETTDIRNSSEWDEISLIAKSSILTNSKIVIPLNLSDFWNLIRADSQFVRWSVIYIRRNIDCVSEFTLHHARVYAKNETAKSRELSLTRLIPYIHLPSM